MKDIAKFVENATISADSVSRIDRQQLVDMLEKFQFARVTGLITQSQMRTSVELLKKSFDPNKDRATTGESKDEVRKNFQKLSIGCARHGNVDRPRFMRTFYNPLWEEDVYKLHSAFRIQSELRNLLGNMPLDYALDTDGDGVWTAARLHHFPAGGGFMVGHRDTVLPAFYETIDLPFFQTLLLVTQKGVDFQTGGGFIELEGENICYEDYCQSGDIVIYNQNTIHGVDDIDVSVPFRQNSLAGRMSGLVTLYRTL